MVIDLSADEPERLYLTPGEARRLATDLEMEMTCDPRRMEWKSQPSVCIADVILTVDEAWQLVDILLDVLGHENLNDPPSMVGDVVPWQKEGF